MTQGWGAVDSGPQQQQRGSNRTAAGMFFGVLAHTRTLVVWVRGILQRCLLARHTLPHMSCVHLCAALCRAVLCCAGC